MGIQYDTLMRIGIGSIFNFKIYVFIIKKIRALNFNLLLDLFFDNKTILDIKITITWIIKILLKISVTQ